MDLTLKQKKTLEFINKFSSRNRYMPSLKEIGKRFKLSSKSSSWWRIYILIRNGLVTKQRYHARSIKLTSKAKKLMKKKELK